VDWRNYISVLTPCAASGNIIFSLETFNAVSNISLTLNVSALQDSDEISTALAIKNQFVTLLTQASAIYTGVPVYSDQDPLATFYIERTDMVVSIWSQAQFRLQVISNNTGSEVRVGPNPVLGTLAQAKAYGPIMGADFSDSNEIALTDNQIMDALELASDQVIRIVNNYFVIANYLQEYTGHMEGSIFLNVGPIVTWDQPFIRRPSILVNLTIPFSQTRLSYSIVRKTKMLNYRYDNAIFGYYDPFDMNNEVKMTYRAGYLNIPRIVTEKVLQVTTLLLNDTNVKTLKGGSFSVEFRLPKETYNSIATELRHFRNSS